MSEVDAILTREATYVAQTKEIARILSCLSLDAYAVLDLWPGVSPDSTRKQYRKKSLYVHPDKCPNENALNAFNLLAKSEKLLADETSRSHLDNLYTEARTQVMVQHKMEATDPRLETDEYKTMIREKVAEVLVELELQRRRQEKSRLESQGADMQVREKSNEAHTRSRKGAQNWEDSREHRVAAWRKHLRRKTRQKKENILG